MVASVQSSWLVSPAESVVVCAVWGGRLSVVGGVVLSVTVGEWVSVVRAFQWSPELHLVAPFVFVGVGCSGRSCA